ncbi:MAG: hypothetical protein IMW90_02545 [Thermogemmatispora sp.]|uniref:hypothetical protein n=1 Tax=Thermogemmatispora sp. TaxID=1968838 RepID=UPI0019E44788|nr:hypothetical protein [Thermogemmatispora sp.]MBE3564587.1 hypothetical protein [Thermogemmatispora sp.]
MTSRIARTLMHSLIPDARRALTRTPFSNGCQVATRLPVRSSGPLLPPALLIR